MSRKIILLFLTLGLGLTVSVAAFEFNYRGYMYSEVQYTPESLWEAARYLQLNSSFNLGQDPRIMLHFYGLWQGKDSKVPFFQSSLGDFHFGLWRASLSLKDPLFLRGSPINVTFGSIPLYYSPYTIRADGYSIEGDSGSYYEKVELRGVKFDSLQLGPLTVEGFYSSVNQAQTYGAKVSGRRGYNNLEAIAVSHRDNQTQEQVYSIESHLVPFDRLIADGTVAWHHRLEQEENPVVVDAQLQYLVMPGVMLVGGYRRIDSEFDPEYRDRSLRFSITSQTEQWNPVDRYRGYDGFYLRITGDSFFGFKTVLERAFYKHSVGNYERSDHTILETQGKLGQYNLAARFESEDRLLMNSAVSGQTNNRLKLDHLAITVNRQIRIKGIPVHASYTVDYRSPYENIGNPYEEADIDLIADQGKTIFRNKLELATTLTRGYFRGVHLKTGLEHLFKNGTEERLYKFVGAEYVTPSGITVAFRFSTPNRVEPARQIGSRTYKYPNFDNLLSFSLSSSF